MVNAARALIKAHGRAVRSAPTEVTIYRLTYGADESFQIAAQHTIAETWRGRALWAPYAQSHEPAEPMSTKSGVVTVNARSVGFVPTAADRLEMGGVFYNIKSVMDMQGAVLVINVEGPSIDPSEAADVTPPRFTALTLEAVSGGFSFTGTINESSQYRIRFRSPAFTGEWSTGTWTVPYSTSASGTQLVAAVEWEVHAQPRDAAGNVGGWYSGGTVTVIPEVGG